MIIATTVVISWLLIQFAVTCLMPSLTVDLNQFLLSIKLFVLLHRPVVKQDFGLLEIPRKCLCQIYYSNLNKFVLIV